MTGQQYVQITDGYRSHGELGGIRNGTVLGNGPAQYSAINGNVDSMMRFCRMTRRKKGCGASFRGRSPWEFRGKWQA